MRPAERVDSIAILRDVVMPVINELLRPEELDCLKLAWRKVDYPMGRLRIGDDELVLQLICVGESFGIPIWPGWGLTTWDRATQHDQLRSALQDFIAESTFGWGQLRGGDVPG